MSATFSCRIPFNADIKKISGYFVNTGIMYVGMGTAGIALFSKTPEDTCYYMIMIHSNDIFQLHVDTDVWKNKGVIRVMEALPFNTFIQTKEEKMDILLESDADAVSLNIKVMNNATVVRSISLPLIVPEMVYEYPPMSYANAVMGVSDFKQICALVVKNKGIINVMIESQKNGIRIYSGDSMYTYGMWADDADTTRFEVSRLMFERAAKVSIGNIKNAIAGIYADDRYPLKFKIKLGIVDFIVYGKKWILT